MKKRHTRKYKKSKLRKGGKSIKSIKITKSTSSKSFKPMNCSPMVNTGKTKKIPVKESCFTPDVLITIKDAYNKHHPQERITTTDPVGIWKDLKTKLRTCNKEDCWLDEIDDPMVRKKIDSFIFAPDHPDDWIKDPDEWLSNFDIMDVLKQYMKTYDRFYAPPPSPIDFDTKPSDMQGQCVSNELCTFDLEKHRKAGKTKFGIVFNVSPHTSSGSHWVSLFVDTDDEFIFYMDSAGSKIPKQINKLVDTITSQGLAMNPPIKLHYYENCPLEHQMGTTECGMFSLFFIITMLSNKAEKRVFKNYVDKIKFFKDKRIPDSYVFKYRKIYFNEK
jgi:hypothetical protein